MEQEAVSITKTEKKRLRKRLEELEKKEAKYMKSYIAAVKEGDERECDAFYLAKDLLEDASQQIIELKSLLKRSKVVNNTTKPKDSSSVIQIGSEIVLAIDDNPPEKYTLVHSIEANPLENKISISCSLGKSIIGKKARKTVNYTTHLGVTYRVRIIEIL